MCIRKRCRLYTVAPLYLYWVCHIDRHQYMPPFWLGTHAITSRTPGRRKSGRSPNAENGIWRHQEGWQPKIPFLPLSQKKGKLVKLKGKMFLHFRNSYWERNEIGLRHLSIPPRRFPLSWKGGKESGKAKRRRKSGRGDEGKGKFNLKGDTKLNSRVARPLRGHQADIKYVWQKYYW